MSATLSAAFRHAFRHHADPVGRSIPHPAVAAAVVRLLAVALMVTNRRAAREESPPLPRPSGYRDWPSIEVGTEFRGRRQRMTCYVSPKAVDISDEDTCPVGTVFVVETRGGIGLAELNASGEKRRATALRSVFVLSKHADVFSDSSNRCAEGAWACATYGPRGELLGRDGSAYGVCRLPLQ